MRTGCGGLLCVTGSCAMLARSLRQWGPASVCCRRRWQFTATIACIFGVGVLLVLLGLFVLLFLPEIPPAGHKTE